MACFSGTNIVNDGLVLHLDAANKNSYPGSGTTWKDLSGNENNGTLVNGVGYNSDNKGAMVFSTNNQYVPSSTNLETVDSIGGLLADSGTIFSVNTWFKWVSNPVIRGSTNHCHAIVGRGGGIGSQATFVVFCSINQYNNGAGGGPIEYGKPYVCIRGRNNKISDERIDIDKWNNIQITWNGVEAKSYFNGYTETTLTPGTFGLQTGSDYRFTLGNVRATSLSNTAFQGSISVASVYNRALTAAEIKQNFEATRSRYDI